MKQSLFRKLTNKALARVQLNGLVIDLGGEKKSSYHKIFQGRYKIITVNINRQKEPDFVFDLENIPWPLPDSQYDGVLMINILEHLYHCQQALKESYRILKLDGQIVGIIPFLFYLHPSPDDYFRYTSQALEKLLKEANFKEIEIKEIGPGALSAAYLLIQRFFPGLIDWVLQPAVIFTDKFLQVISIKLGKKYRRSHYPLGYLIKAKKLRALNNHSTLSSRA